MSNFKYPIGLSKYVDIDDVDLDSFIRFIECDIINDNLELNFLQYRDKLKRVNNTNRTMTGVYFIKELNILTLYTLTFFVLRLIFSDVKSITDKILIILLSSLNDL